MTQIEWTAGASAKRRSRGLGEALRDIRISSSLTLGFGVLLGAALVLTPYLPMVDLPQHAALLGAWVRLSDPTAPEAQTFVVNWRTPYLTAYVLCRMLAEWLSVSASMKIVVALSCAGFQLAFALLVQRLDYPRWLALFGVPLSVGFSFYYGFLSFLVGIPFALGALWAAFGYAENPNARRGLLLGGLLAAALLSHGFAATIALAISTPVLLSGRAPLVRRVLPVLAPLLLGAIWLLPGPAVGGIGRTIWEPRFFELWHLPALLLASSSADRTAWLLGVCLLVLVVSTLGRLHSNPWRWLPLAAILGGFCLFPAMQSGFAPTYPRLAAFLVPALLVAFEPRAGMLRPTLAGKSAALLATLVCASWLATSATRLISFQRETAPIARLIERLPGGLAMRPIVFERGSASFPGLPARLHLPAYYAAEKGGQQGYSFAMYPTSVLRYTPDVFAGMQGGAEWHPETFSAEDELPFYDCFMVHSSRDRSRELFGDHLDDVEWTVTEGAWRVYGFGERARARAHSQYGTSIEQLFPVGQSLTVPHGYVQRFATPSTVPQTPPRPAAVQLPSASRGQPHDVSSPSAQARASTRSSTASQRVSSDSSPQ